MQLSQIMLQQAPMISVGWSDVTGVKEPFSVQELYDLIKTLAPAPRQ